MDGGAWWAAVYGVSQNWTRLKRLSSSSSNSKGCRLNSQRSLEKEEWSWRYQPSWLQIIVQSYSHQDSMVLAQRQKYRSMVSCEAVWTWAFVFWKVTDYSFNFRACDWSVKIFYFFLVQFWKVVLSKNLSISSTLSILLAYNC